MNDRASQKGAREDWRGNKLNKEKCFLVRGCQAVFGSFISHIPSVAYLFQHRV
jgi:hypothetical protein